MCLLGLLLFSSALCVVLIAGIGEFLQKMPAVKGDGMRGLAVFISDIRNCELLLLWTICNAIFSDAVTCVVHYFTPTQYWESYSLLSVSTLAVMKLLHLLMKVSWTICSALMLLVG